MEALTKKYPERRRGEDLPRARAERDLRPQEHGAAGQGDRRSSSRSTRSIPTTRASRITSSTATTSRRSRRRACRPRTSTRRSRRRRRTRSTCLRTSTRWSACGRNRSLRTSSRSRCRQRLRRRRPSSTACSPAYRTRYDFMQYAYLQLGQDAKAKALIEQSAAIKKVIGPVSAGNTARAAVPGALLSRAPGLEGRGAAPAARHPVSRRPRRSRISRARMGAARSGDPAAAQADIDKLKAAARRAGKGQSVVLGRAGRGPDPRRPGLDRAGPRQQGARRSSSCAPPPTSKTGARSTSRWRIVSTRCASCSATC